MHDYFGLKNPKVFHNLLRQQDSCYLLNKQKIHLQNHHLGIKHKINKYKILTIKQ